MIMCCLLDNQKTYNRFLRMMKSMSRIYVKIVLEQHISVVVTNATVRPSRSPHVVFGLAGCTIVIISFIWLVEVARESSACINIFEESLHDVEAVAREELASNRMRSSVESPDIV